MSHEAFEVFGLDAVTILADQDWTDTLDDEGYHEALATMVDYLSHSAAAE
jgi:hypothetical protein